MIENLSSKKMSKFYCGTSGWNYKHWRVVFYPDHMPQSKWLEHYSETFDTVELNNSFYRLPEKSTFEKWHDASPQDFVFAVKASRYLTHIKRLMHPEEPLERLLSHSSGLGEKRGPILYQFSPSWNMSEENLGRLGYFLNILPGDVRHVFEFRNNSWHNDKLWSMLDNHSAAYCIMDSPSLPQHLITTGGFTYIRMHSGGEATEGNYTIDQLTAYAHHIEGFLAKGDVYIYFNNDYKGFAVDNALTLKALFNGKI